MSRVTIYQYATDAMHSIIAQLVQLAAETHEFTVPLNRHWQDERASVLLLLGKGVPLAAMPAQDERQSTWLARSALPFNLEKAATGILYARLSAFTDQLIGTAFEETNAFARVDVDWIRDNPHYLPVIMHAMGTFSKQELAALVGPVSDASISNPAANKIAELITATHSTATQEQVRERIKATTEGVVRDLVGRLLLETFVATGLSNAGVPYRRESDYPALTGVVYDFRADFVIPDEHDPRAFIEVRKSSTRHASLYAKDKMFSAINWKGKHQQCLGILVVEGPWSATSLEVMARVFDYVVPLSKVPEVARKVHAYLNGDKTVLRWLVTFQIQQYVPDLDANVKG